jgi:hypothetical protein
VRNCNRGREREREREREMERERKSKEKGERHFKEEFYISAVRYFEAGAISNISKVHLIGI